MATIQPYCAKEMFDPPTYHQAIKVTGAQTILFLSGQVAYEEFFGKKMPASTLVEVSALAHPDWLIEVEAIAVL